MPFVYSQDRPYSLVSSPALFVGSGTSGPTGYLPANGRFQVYAQVVGSGSPIYISLNGSPASTGNFNIMLKAPAVDMGADGGVWSDTAFQGPVFASGASLGKFILWESRN